MKNRRKILNKKLVIIGLFIISGFVFLFIHEAIGFVLAMIAFILMHIKPRCILF